MYKSVGKWGMFSLGFGLKLKLKSDHVYLLNSYMALLLWVNSHSFTWFHCEIGAPLVHKNQTQASECNTPPPGHSDPFIVSAGLMTIMLFQGNPSSSSSCGKICPASLKTQQLDRQQSSLDYRCAIMSLLVCRGFVLWLCGTQSEM